MAARAPRPAAEPPGGAGGPPVAETRFWDRCLGLNRDTRRHDSEGGTVTADAALLWPTPAAPPTDPAALALYTQNVSDKDAVLQDPVHFDICEDLRDLLAWFNAQPVGIPYVAALGMAYDLAKAVRYTLLSPSGVVPPATFKGIRLTTVPLCTSAFLQYMVFLRKGMATPPTERESFLAVILSEVSHLVCDDNGIAKLKFSNVKVIDYQPIPWQMLPVTQLTEWSRIYWRMWGCFIQISDFMKADIRGMNFTSEWNFNTTDTMVGGGSSSSRKKKPVLRQLPAPRHRW